MAEKKNSKTNSSAKKTSSTKTSTKKTTTKKVAAKEVTPVKETKKEKVVKETTPIVKEEIKTEKHSVIETVKANATLIFLCIICLLLIINIVLIAIGHKVELSDGKEVVASIDGKVITADELYESVKETFATNSLINIIDEVIIEKEIEDVSDAEEEAKKQVASIKGQYEQMGYKWEDILSNYGYTSEQVLIDEIKNSLLKEEVAVKFISKNITDEEIKKYYDENVEDSYTAKHILITPDTTEEMTDEEVKAAEEAALTTANEIVAKLNSGEDWNTLVNTYSEDTGSKENGGLIENFTKGDVVDEFFNATKNLTDGIYTTEPVKSKFGYHIILRVSKTEKEALENMKDDLVNEIIDSKLADDKNLFTTTWDSIRKSYNLKINDTTIENYYNQTISK